MSKFAPPIGTRISSIRIMRGLTRRDLAGICGVDEQDVIAWEKADMPEDIDDEDLSSISFALDLDTGAFTQDTQGFLIMMTVAKLSKFGKKTP